jgi:hypothetical protein
MTDVDARLWKRFGNKRVTHVTSPAVRASDPGFK